MRVLLGVAVCVALAGCTGGADGGEPKRYGSGVHDIESFCRDDVDTRYFRVDSGPGVFRMNVLWDDVDGEDIDLYVEDPDDDEGLFAADDEIPPGDSPAQVEVTVPVAMNLLATVECYDAVEFTGRITVP